jgi:hypothetical protein
VPALPAEAAGALALLSMWRRAVCASAVASLTLVAPACASERLLVRKESLTRFFPSAGGGWLHWSAPYGVEMLRHEGRVTRIKNLVLGSLGTDGSGRGVGLTISCTQYVGCNVASERVLPWDRHGRS